MNDLPVPVINLAKRIFSMARQYDGMSVIKIVLIANGSGVPVMWLKPTIVPLEPRLEMDILSLEKNLGEEELQRLLQIVMLMS